MSAPARATLIGGRGFIGRHLQSELLESGWSYYVAARDDAKLTQSDLGHVFYCAGLTADFRQRPYATVDAHVQLLSHILQHSAFSTLTYLSSTRVYAGAAATDENAALTVRAHEPGDLYNLSKLLGESLCLNSGRPVHIVRLSNVYGENMPSQNFLAEVLTAAARERRVEFRSAPDSQKDYISIRDVTHYLPLIASQGETGIYNLARGENSANAEIAAFLRSRGVQCDFAEQAPSLVFPRIDTTRLRKDFGAPQHDLASDLPALYSHYCETL